jgi:hypothetical protein
MRRHSGDLKGIENELNRRAGNQDNHWSRKAMATPRGTTTTVAPQSSPDAAAAP